MLAAGAGAAVTLVSHHSVERARGVAAMCAKRYGVTVGAACAADTSQRRALLRGKHVVLASGKAGVRVLDRVDLESADALWVAADVNAVPPEGIEGVAVMDSGKPLAAASGRAVGIGALAIGNVKYKVQRGLFEAMLSADKPQFIDFRDAFARARALVG
jgi:methylene-tetrahydromethanopterin dehydrogenase